MEVTIHRPRISLCYSADPSHSRRAAHPGGTLRGGAQSTALYHCAPESSALASPPPAGVIWHELLASLSHPSCELWTFPGHHNGNLMGEHIVGAEPDSGSNLAAPGSMCPAYLGEMTPYKDGVYSQSVTVPVWAADGHEGTSQWLQGTGFTAHGGSQGNLLPQFPLQRPALGSSGSSCPPAP